MANLRRMAAPLAHRGPDSEGYWAEDHSGFGLAHKRLAILGSKDDAHQPMTSTSGRYVLALNGEIYNHPDLHRELRQLGCRFQGGSDTRTVLEGFSRWGISATLSRITGMFAIALWDRQTQTLTLMRDRFGEKPLYYGWQSGVFLFGSELGALRAHPAFQAPLSTDAIRQYFQAGHVPAPLSIYDGIHKLPAGHMLTVGAGTSQADPVPYWSISSLAETGQADRFQGGEQAAAFEVKHLIENSVTAQMQADVPLGVFLSGGIDSSLVAGLMQANSTAPIRSFSLGFTDPSYNEISSAKAVAAHLGTDHTSWTISDAEACAVVPDMGRIYDEPFADASQIPTYLLSKHARHDVTVALSGDGADELFGGYDRYLSVSRLWRRVQFLPIALRRAFARLLMAIPSRVFARLSAFLISSLTRPDEKARKIAAILMSANTDEAYLRVCAHWTGSDLQSIGPAANTPLTDPEHRMMLADGRGYLSDGVLVKTDRATMAASLEMRAPFLDHHLAAFAWRLPLAQKIRNKQGKQILRQVLHQYVPEQLTNRPKMGFGAPVGRWLNGPLRDWAEDMLRPERLGRHGFVDVADVRQKWRAHKDGRQNWHEHLWDVLMFENWLAEAAP